MGMSDMKFAGVAALGAAGIAPSTNVTVFGIPMGLILAGCAGAMFALAYTPPEKWGKLLAPINGSKWRRAGIMAFRASGMLFMLVGIVIVMGWAALAVPHAPLMEWTERVPPPAIAGLLCFFGQFWLPRVIDASNRWIENKGKPTVRRRRGPP